MVTQVEETPILLGQNGPLQGRQWNILHKMLLGRGKTCDIIIPNRQVSRYHAKINQHDGTISIEDLGSKNGTHVNGSKIKVRTTLHDGDVVQIALAQDLIFVSAESTLPLNVNPGPPRHAPGYLRLDKRSHRVWIGKKELLPALSAAQFQVLEILYKQEGQVVSRAYLTEQIWGLDGSLNISAQALDALLRRLRSRLAEVDKKQNFIKTVRGHGLRFENKKR